MAGTPLSNEKLRRIDVVVSNAANAIKFDTAVRVLKEHLGDNSIQDIKDIWVRNAARDILDLNEYGWKL